MHLHSSPNVAMDQLHPNLNFSYDMIFYVIFFSNLRYALKAKQVIERCSTVRKIM